MKSLNEIDLQALLKSEQARKIAIGLGVGILALAVIFYLFVQPANAVKGDMLKKIADAQTQLENDQRLIANQETIRENHRDIACQLLKIMDKTLAPSQNAVAWVGTLFQDIAFEEGLKMTDITGEPMNIPMQDKTEVPLFEKFKGKAGLQARYHNLGRFIAELETRIPITELVVLNVSQPMLSEAEVPPLQITLEFAFPRFTEAGFPAEQRPTQEDCLATTNIESDNTPGT